MKKYSIDLLFLSFLALIITTPSFGTPFTAIRIGDIDGFGYGAGAGLTAANGGPVNVGAGGVLGAESLPLVGDFLPDLNGGGSTLTGGGDDFDNRSAAEIAGNSLSGQGYTNITTTGSQFTDISLSTSYDTSSAGGNVYNANTSSYGTGGPFPTPPSGSLSNQPGFVFDFFVAAGDIAAGTNVFFNMLFGDYDVTPASIRFTRADNTTFNQNVSTQSGAADGLIQAAFATLAFGDVFSATTGGWSGKIKVDFLAPNEPYTAFDFVELSVKPIQPNVVPEPTTMLLFGFGLIGIAGISRRKK